MMFQRSKFKPSDQIPAERQGYEMWATGRVGLLIVHGFMGSPKSTRPLAAHLQSHHISTICPLLPGHGHLPYKIHQVHHQKWLDTAAESLHKLQNRCDELFVLGHSMGAVAAGYVAHHYPAVKGVILIAPHYDVPDPRIRWFKYVRYILPYVYPLLTRHFPKEIALGRVTDFDPTINLEDPEVQKWLMAGTKLSTSGIDEMRKMGDLGRALWPFIQQPALVFQGQQDKAINPLNAQKVYDLLGSTQKEMVWLRRSGHEPLRPCDPDHLTTWHKIIQFMHHA